MRQIILCIALATTALVGCTTIQTKRIVYERHPIAVRVVSTVIDEEVIEYSVKFRNVGREILSFDYTVADEPGVPHVDKFGPNSGFVENLYPGAEIEVPNPMNRMAVHVTLGTVTYGKKSSSDLESIYNPGATIDALEQSDELFPPKEL